MTAENRPQFIGPHPSAICSLLPRALILTGVFRDTLVHHFAAPEYIEEPDLRQLIWQEGERTGIIVESVHRWRPELTEKRPAVIIKRNAYQNQRFAIGDRHQLTRGHRGDLSYATWWVGSHTLFCMGGSGAQAELLATEVQRELTEFGPLLQRTLWLHRFQLMGVGEVSELEESTQHFVVPVNVGYAFQETWTLRQQAPTLKRFSLSMILDA